MKRVQILGTNCSRCKKLAENVEAAAKALGLLYKIEKVEVNNPAAIMNLGMTLMPALAIGGQIKIAGRVPSVAELQKMLIL
ncbi:MAG: thioredoxin family protein [bacterium]